MTVSACIIHRDDPHLPKTVACLRACPLITEVVIVDTGSEDKGALAKSLADRFEFFTECNDADGLVADFAAARARSYALASQPWIVWADSDDLVVGLEHLGDAITAAERAHHGRVLCPYEYKYHYDDPAGMPIYVQQRERIVRNDGAFHWEHPVHETLVPVDGVKTDIYAPGIVWKHQRTGEPKDKERNLRILRAYAKNGGLEKDEGWTRYNLGCECAHAGEYAEAIEHLTKYIDLSGWADQQMLACFSIIDCYVALDPLGEYIEAFQWAKRALEMRPDIFDTHFAMAKLHMLRGGTRLGAHEDLRAVISWCTSALKQTGTTPIVQRPIDRERYAYEMIAAAHETIGDWDEAVADLSQHLERAPGHTGLLLSMRDYEERRRTAKGERSAHDGKLDVVIACCDTPETWDPTTPNSRGIGGSETAVIEMAKRLVKLGARVRVYNKCAEPGLHDGVEYRWLEQIAGLTECDLLIAWRWPKMLEFLPAKVKWLWVHDVDALDASRWNLYLADRVFVLSEWHKQAFTKLHPEVADKLTVTRNGLDLARFERYDIARNSRKAIFSSSPDRGVAQLLDMWPAVRERVPDAELHLFYASFEPWPKLAERVREMAAQGVIARGRVDQNTLAREMLSAGVWVHPSWQSEYAFTETSCIGALEAQAAGMWLVASNVGALPETIGNRGMLIDGKPSTEEYREAFVSAVVSAMRLNTPMVQLARSELQIYAHENFDWQPVANQWMALGHHDVAVKERPARVVEDVSDDRPLLYMALTPSASGVIMDASDYGNEPMGGGSRLGYLGLLDAMAKLGRYKIRALSTWKQEYLERDGVEYVRLDCLAQYPKPDVLFGFYDTSTLRQAPAGVLRIGSHHTYLPPYLNFEYIDVNTAPSQESLEHLRDTYAPDAPWYVLPNGVPPMNVERNPVPGRVIYHTSADRGLHLLLGAWPSIKEAVPYATLHVVGPVAATLKGKLHPGALGARIDEIRVALPDALEAGGVTLTDRLTREELLHELSDASVFAFPASVILPCETFSLSIMECCSIGLPVVLCPVDSLESIYKGSVCMVDAPAEEHMGEFVDAVVEVLTNEQEAAKWSERGKRLAAGYTFAAEAHALDAIIQRHMKRDAKAVAA